MKSLKLKVKTRYWRCESIQSHTVKLAAQCFSVLGQRMRIMLGTEEHAKLVSRQKWEQGQDYQGMVSTRNTGLIQTVVV